MPLAYLPAGAGVQEDDDEHESLRGLIARMRAVVAHTGSPTLAAEAVDTIADRIEVHFQEEEASLSRQDTALEVMRVAHAELRSLLGRLRQTAHGRPYDRPAVLAALDVTADALDVHEREVDIPLFQARKAG